MLCYNPPISLPINSFSKNFIRISTILHSAILLEIFGITPIPALAAYLIVTSTTVTIPQYHAHDASASRASLHQVGLG